MDDAGTGTAIGTTQQAATGEKQIVALRRHRDVNTWAVLGGSAAPEIQRDLVVLERKEVAGGITFITHPLATDLVWLVDEKTQAKHLQHELDRQRKRSLREQHIFIRRTAAVEKIKRAREAERWHYYQQLQPLKRR